MLHAYLIYTLSSYLYWICSTFLLWELIRSFITDINECESDNGNCTFVCHNTPGSYYCGCKTGYVLSSDDTCKDPDECVTGNHRCEHFCVNTQVSCSCNSGYELGNDSISCIDVNECNTTEHGCGHGCINTLGSFECQGKECKLA